MNLSVILFLIGILGFVLNRKNIILMLISIEIMLLAVTLLILTSSYNFDDILGQTYSIYIIAIAILWYVLCPFRLTTICMLLEKEPYNDILFAFVFGLGMYHFLVG